MSKQRGLSADEQRVEQTLSAYLQTKAGCPGTWYQRWLPLLFKKPCEASIHFYTGLDRSGRPMDDDSTGNSFAIVVSEHDGTLCRRDSSELKREARFFARQVRPVLLPAHEYQWVTVEYSSCPYYEGDQQGCHQDCQKVVQLALHDTSAWPNAAFYPSAGAHLKHYQSTPKRSSPF